MKHCKSCPDSPQGQFRMRARTARLPRLSTALAACLAAACLAAGPCQAWAEPDAAPAPPAMLAAASEAETPAGNAVGATVSADGLEFKVASAAEPGGAHGTATLESAADFEGASLALDTVSATVDGVEYVYDVVGVASRAAYGNDALASVSFSRALVQGSPAIGAYAFANCANLESVSFSGDVAGIGDHAFQYCRKLSSVSFAQGSALYVNSVYSTAAIGAGAFRGCSSLRTLSIPPIPSATRFGDAYGSFADYNPASNQQAGISDLSLRYCSGYQPWWHSGAAPVCRDGISSSAFSGCSSLATVIFQAGAPLGAYAYFYLGSSFFEQCPKLDSLVFMSRQAYAADPNGSLHNGGYTDFFADTGAPDAPDLYYAVDYYASAEASAADGSADASARLARVEYRRSTPVASIAAGDAAALSSWVYPDAQAYRLLDSDGTVPDPNEAAVAAGLSSSTTWVWKLCSGQSRRAGLTDSCRAYLVAAGDLAAGRLAGGAMDALQKACDQNFSRWLLDGAEQDSGFDAKRYYDPHATYAYGNGAASVTDSYQVGTASSEALAGSAWVELSGDAQASLLGALSVCAADGAQLPSSAYALSFKRYDSATASLVPTELGAQDGPVLVTVSAQANSGYTGSFDEWVLVRAHAGTVLARYTDTSAATFAAAIWYDGEGSANRVAAGAASVQVGSKDLPSALVACGYAGLTSGLISVADESSEGYGFALSASSKDASFPRDSRFADAADFAAKAYAAFERRTRGELGLASAAYPWGGSAVLVSEAALHDVAGPAASLSYALAAPVFFAAEDGSVSADTLGCLDDFPEVIVVGDAAAFSESALSSLRGKLGSAISVKRLTGDAGSIASLSTAVADELIARGAATCSTVAVYEAADPLDAIGCLNLAGKAHGISLAVQGSADAKAQLSYAYDKRYGIDRVRLFGRGPAAAGSDAYDLEAAFGALWSGAAPDVAPASGDTLALYGALFAIGGGGSAITHAGDIYEHGVIPAGSYSHFGKSYTLAAPVAAYSGSALTAVEAPVAARGLVYTGKKLTGVAAGEGYSVKSGTAVHPGSYTAVATLEEGYVWSDGTSEPKSISYAIGKAAQKLKAKKKTITVSAAKLAKKAVSVKAAKVKKGNSAKGKITYRYVKANKSKRKFQVAKSGKLTIKKGVKRGTYKLIVRATAAETADYKSTFKKFAVTLKVK